MSLPPTIVLDVPLSTNAPFFGPEYPLAFLSCTFLLLRCCRKVGALGFRSTLLRVHKALCRRCRLDSAHGTVLWFTLSRALPKLICVALACCDSFSCALYSEPSSCRRRLLGLTWLCPLGAGLLYGSPHTSPCTEPSPSPCCSLT